MNLRTLSLAAALCLPAAGLAQGTPAVPNLKPTFEGAPAPQPKSAQAGGQERPELDVSKMPFTPDSIKQVVMHHMPDIQQCYERVLSDTGQHIQGKVVVGFVVDPNGHVTDARVLPKKSTLKDERVHDCVLAMKGWTFPKTGDNRDHPIEYPFVLKVQK